MYSFFVLPAFAETASDNSILRNQYEINSETIYYPHYYSNSELVEADLRLLVGRRLDIFGDRDLRLAVGGYEIYSDSKNFDYNYRQGGLAQAKLNFWQKRLFFVYEYHYYTLRTKSDYENENRFGFYAGHYQQLSERSVLDIYAETFLIPEISSNHLISTGRASIYWDTMVFDYHIFDLLAEVYVKDAPINWSKIRTELRLGFKLQPWDFISAKVYIPIFARDKEVTDKWQAQLNIYKVSDF